ncbi:hypothetical protein [Clostridium cadaveris]|uniref:Uncharacterized protein n=1 Tax=Clostridium cadaveris TaxID=1529 RepID=A0A316M0G4_9CLOT|nr:MAG: hypothetical protein DBY38_12235 [Clostridium cadaveris]
MEKKKIRMLFNSCAAAIENVADTGISTQEGQLEEVGVCLEDDYFITYHEKNDVIHFYNGTDDSLASLLTIDSTSPLLLMFQELMAIEKYYRED